mgnify:CR=1 FL=1
MKQGLFFLSMLISLACAAQERSEIIQQRIEFISEQLETENIDLTNLLEQFNFYIDNPIDLNKSSREALNDLGMLTDNQNSDLLVHSKLHAKLNSIYELHSMKFWDLETIYLVLPFVTLDERLDGLHLTFKEAIVCFSLKMIRTKEARSFLGFHLKHSLNNLHYAE